MSKYMIHTCKQREWYVSDYLLPSMYEQGIPDADIFIKEDLFNDGALESCMQSFKWIGKTQPKDGQDGNIWHLQDDIVLSKYFAERTNYLDQTENCIICGFASEYDNHEKDREEYVSPEYMWYSFPCIRIPNTLAKECADWFYKIKNKPEYAHIIRSKKHDDYMFKQLFLADKNVLAKNLIPNLVDHIDYLIGGSLINTNRDNKIIRSVYWEDESIVNELAMRLGK